MCRCIPRPTANRPSWRRNGRSCEPTSTGEHKELAAIYVGRGLDKALAAQVADQLMAHDALDAHARDELGITEILRARPLQAAGASALSFAIGAALPLLVVLMSPVPLLLWSVFITSLVFLAILGGLAARTGGAPVRTGVIRITFWGALAMAITTGVGMLFGVRPETPCQAVCWRT